MSLPDTQTDNKGKRLGLTKKQQDRRDCRQSKDGPPLRGGKNNVAHQCSQDTKADDQLVYTAQCPPQMSRSNLHRHQYMAEVLQ